MFYIKYRQGFRLCIQEAGEDLDEAEAMKALFDQYKDYPAPDSIQVVDVEILVDLETADETARAMAFGERPTLLVDVPDTALYDSPAASS